MIETYAYARAGLLGNPSDGYYGKTISFLVRDFHARAKIPHQERDGLAVVTVGRITKQARAGVRIRLDHDFVQCNLTGWSSLSNLNGEDVQCTLGSWPAAKVVKYVLVDASQVLVSGPGRAPNGCRNAATVPGQEGSRDITQSAKG